MCTGHDRHDVTAYVRPSRDGPGVLHLSDYLIPNYAPLLGFGLVEYLHWTLVMLCWVILMTLKHLTAGHGALGYRADVRVTHMYIAVITFTVLYSLQQRASYAMTTVTLAVF